MNLFKGFIDRIQVLLFKNFRGLRLTGPVSLSVAIDSKIQIKGDQPSYFGVPTLGKISRTKSTSILEVQKNASLILSSVSIGRGSRISLKANALLEIGDQTYLSDDCFISTSESIRIGKSCAISWEVQFFDDDGHKLADRDQKQAISIGDHVWIGSRTTILRGTHLGSGCVVAAGSVVKGTFPDHSLIGGVPAKILRERVSWVSSTSELGSTGES